MSDSTAYTKILTTLPVAASALNANRTQKLQVVIVTIAKKFEQVFNQLCNNLQEKFNAKMWIPLNKAGDPEGVFYFHDIVGLIPNLDKHQCNAGDSYHYLDSNYVTDAALRFCGFKGVVPTYSEVQRMFNDRIKNFRASNGNIIVCGSNRPGVTYVNGSSYLYMWTSNGRKYSANNYNSYEREYFWVIPIFRFSGADVNGASFTPWQVIRFWLSNALTPNDDLFASKNALYLFNMIKANHPALSITAEGVTLNREYVFNAVKAGQTFDFLPDLKNILGASEIKGDENLCAALKNNLLNCDQVRAALDPYDANLLTDPNRGHWDLWDFTAPTDSAGQVVLLEPFVARNPVVDINSGIVGIDFGTSSTVVVYENERGKIMPLQVGSGHYSDGVRRENYENPTIIQFLHIENFIGAYRARAGRPQTRWDDVTVSHNAMSNLLNTTDSRDYYSFLENIKQWCGAREKKNIRLRDRDGAARELPGFMELADDDFNPLEIYAYYLGAYINHMMQERHIFMEYILSFPVTYEKNIRDKMLRDFRRGLMKSLPTALLSNEEAMKKFRVVEGASEPAAYAITALEAYDYPRGDKEIYYGVFDFGGGTTDFDFGVYRESNSARYDYELTHFGANGDRTLGGENLLRLLAFEVFKLNIDLLLKPEPNKKIKIPFTWAADKLDFPGSEAIIKDSQEANLNMYNVMKVLRPLWEAPQSEEARKIRDSGEIEVNLFCDDGTQKTSVKLRTMPEGYKNVSAGDISNSAEDAVELDDEKISAAATAAVLEATMAVTDAADNDLDVEGINALIQKRIDDVITDFELDGKDADKVRSAVKNFIARAGSKQCYLETILRARIERGIKDFFIAMREAFAKSSGGTLNRIMPVDGVKEAAIFLAGNSSKSKLVKEIFREYIGEGGKARQILGLRAEQSMPEFILYPPLGTDEAYALQRKLGVEVDPDNLENPTGKTGVAFGLLRSRGGAGIKVIDIRPTGAAVPFQYYVGRRRRKKFKVVIDRNTALDRWYEFIDASEPDFDILYTDNASAATNEEDASIARRLTIHLDQTDAEAMVYVRATGAREIEYKVSRTPEQLDDPALEPTKIQLK